MYLKRTKIIRGRGADSSVVVGIWKRCQKSLWSHCVGVIIFQAWNKWFIASYSKQLVLRVVPCLVLVP